MNILQAWRIARVVLHLFAGMLTCGMVFPWVSSGVRNRYIQRWSRQLLRICNVSVEQMPGATALPHAMIVANHVSWLDIFVINTLHPCRFVAKSEIRSWPLVGWLVDKAGTVFIARGSRRDLRNIFKGLVASLHLGERVAFFPEGETAMQGHMLPFHANLFEAAIDAKVPVQPYALKYVDAAGLAHPAVDYVGDTTFVQSMMTVLKSRPVRAQLTCLAPMEATGAHRRELSQACEQAIAQALV
jgi:1-acyl-sn-glycerol-3-phosphate acyltransferase